MQMVIRNVGEFALKGAAQRIDVSLVDFHREGTGYRFRLMPNGPRFKRLGFTRTTRGNRRHIGAVCWHGYRDFMLDVFKGAPEAVMVTAMARYEGIEDFERKFEYTGDQNVGSMMDPVAYRDL